MSQDLLQQAAEENGLIAYKDPDSRNRYVIVYKGWDLKELAKEVARPGGTRWSPLMIGSKTLCLGFIWGLAHGIKYGGKQ